MKKTYKRILSALGIIILLFALLFIGYFIKATSITKDLYPIETGEIIKNVISVKESFSNFYLIEDGGKYIAIDAGNKPGDIRNELKKLTIAPDKIAAVLLTHSDGDHVAGISLFKNAVIYLSKQEEQMINGEKSMFFIFGNNIGTTKYNLIEDQQIIKIGNVKIQGFLTPGHTPGSMCYLVNDTILFTGDALRLKQGKVEKFYSFFNMESETAVKSIGKIIQIPGVKYIFTAHNGYSDNFETAIKNWR